MASFQSLPRELIDEIFSHSIRPQHNILLFPSLDDCPQSRRASHTHPRHQPTGPNLRTSKQLFDVTCMDRVEMFTYLSLRKTSFWLAKSAQEYFYKQARFVLLHFMFNGEIATLWESRSLRALVSQMQYLEFELPYLSWGLERSSIAAPRLARPRMATPYMANCFKLRLHRQRVGWNVGLEAEWEQIARSAARHIDFCKRDFCSSLEKHLGTGELGISTLAAANDQLRRMLWAIWQGTDVEDWEEENCMQVAAMNPGPVLLSHTADRKERKERRLKASVWLKKRFKALGKREQGP